MSVLLHSVQVQTNESQRAKVTSPHTKKVGLVNLVCDRWIVAALGRQLGRINAQDSTTTLILWQDDGAQLHNTNFEYDQFAII